jgi:hypothetical protein
MPLQKGERETAQMQQCKAWWDEHAALAAQQRQQQLQEKQELAVTVKTLDAIQLSMKEQEGAIQAQLEAQVGRGAAGKVQALWHSVECAVAAVSQLFMSTRCIPAMNHNKPGLQATLCTSQATACSCCMYWR